MAPLPKNALQLPPVMSDYKPMSVVTTAGFFVVMLGGWIASWLAHFATSSLALRMCFGKPASTCGQKERKHR